MAATKQRKVARALLFDRLVDQEPENLWEEHAFRTLDLDQLRQSVITEIAQLLNSRSPLPADQLQKGSRDTLNFGIPDLAFFAVRNHDSEMALLRALTEAIAAFEPRLVNVSVALGDPLPDPNKQKVKVSGFLQLGDQREPLSFDVVAMSDEMDRG